MDSGKIKTLVMPTGCNGGIARKTTMRGTQPAPDTRLLGAD